MQLTPENIKRLRLARGETQEDFAHACGVTTATAVRWEHGRSLPNGRLMRQHLSKLMAEADIDGEGKE